MSKIRPKSGLRENIKVPLSRMACDYRQQRTSKSTGGGSGHNHNHSHLGCRNKQQSQVHSQFDKFCLHSPNDASLKRITEFVGAQSLNRFRVCVVTIISKDSLDESMKTHLVRSLQLNQSNRPTFTKRISENVLTSLDLQESEDYDVENQVVGHVDYRNGLILLNLTSFLEADKLYSLSENVAKQSSNEGNTRSAISDAWPKWNQNLLKTLLILFSISHIVVFYNPEPSIDYNLIHLFKILQTLRTKSQTRIVDLLETIASTQVFSPHWVRQARISCPRALFVCDTSYLGVSIDNNDMTNMKQDLEDQIYLLLKKTDIILKPIGGQGVQQSLLTLPERDFVFFVTQRDLKSLGTGRPIRDCKETESKDYYTELFKFLDLDINYDKIGQNITNTHDSDLKKQDSSPDDVQDEDNAQSLSVDPSQPKLGRHPIFWKFLHKHIADIQGLAHQDLDNKHPYNRHLVYTILPRFDDFFTVLLRLKCLLFPLSQSDEIRNTNQSPLAVVQWSTPDERRFVDIYDLVNDDELFSKRHCQKARIVAFESYTRAVQMPPFNETTHQSALESAKSLYLNHARGPACSLNFDLLIEQCNRHWLNLGHSTREDEKDVSRFNKSAGNRVATQSEVAPSTSNTNISPINNSNYLRGSKSGLSVSRRLNGVIITSTCECGHDSSILVAPTDRKKKLERVDVHRLSD